MIWHDLISILAPLLTKVVFLLAFSYLLERVLLKTGKWWYQFVSFPGVVIHELGHALACLMTLTRVNSFNLFASRDDGTLGQVTHEKRNVIVGAVIGMVPFFFGGTVIFLLSKYVFEIYAFRTHRIAGFEIGGMTTWAQYSSFVFDLGMSYYREAVSIIRRLDFRMIKTYIYLYLLLSIAMHLKPSSEYRKNFLVAFFLLIFLSFGVYKGLEFLHIAEDYDLNALLSAGIKQMNYIFDKGIGFTIIGGALFTGVLLASTVIGKIAPKSKT